LSLSGIHKLLWLILKIFNFGEYRRIVVAPKKMLFFPKICLLGLPYALNTNLIFILLSHNIFTKIW
jgi:hypothetical protein